MWGRNLYLFLGKIIVSMIEVLCRPFRQSAENFH